ncbi:kinase-like domain-containing protein [Rhypophila decipiens]|uniref:Kinase-like domain-containing protein n=1 Tax=Rhypophila decipiens TaxID=261697 RepID=A0AAN6YA09_9PEZI|nr:kinase-like domain-containing protein [Rhypophila decipiens]
MSRTKPTITPDQLILLDRYRIDEYTHFEPEEGAVFFHITADDRIYRGVSSTDETEITTQECASLLLRIHDRFVYPPVHKQTKLTLLPVQDKHDRFSDSTSFYIKRPRYMAYDERRTTVHPNFLTRSMLQEICALERISQNPHPFIAKYHGCRVRRGRITGIVLDRAEITLEDAVDDPRFEDLHANRFFEGVTSAVMYLHCLGLAHNDLNPSNIMISKDGGPVLIDFDSCLPFGHPLDKFGVAGWTDMDPEDYKTPNTSERRHDMYAMGKLIRWLLKRFPGDN